MTAISFVIPTRDRPDDLVRTIAALGAYPAPLLGDAEIVVVDNASEIRAEQVLPTRTTNGIPIESIRLDENIHTAARNTAARAASGAWLVMLDDDSAPVLPKPHETNQSAGDFVRTLDALPESIAAIGGEIFLPSGSRESGGLPEVIIGCGSAIRRDVFLSAGGYDPAFGYYAEEYDLCARLIASGHTIAHTDAIAFLHRKVTKGRNFSEILYRLVRNNAWVIARHAPDRVRDQALEAMLDRYRGIASKESVLPAYERAHDEALATMDTQTRTPLAPADWDRFTGEAAARAGVETLKRRLPAHTSARLVKPGKGADLIERTLTVAGFSIENSSDLGVIGTLSPGPMRDAHERHPDAHALWSFLSPE